MKVKSLLHLLVALLLAGTALVGSAGGSEADPMSAPGRSVAAQHVGPAQPAVAKRAYMLIEARITDMARFGRYTQAIVPIVQRHGGRYLVMRGVRETLEGDWGDTRVVVSEWPSMDAARAFWNDPEYRAAVKLREGTGEFRVLLMEGVESAPTHAP